MFRFEYSSADYAQIVHAIARKMQAEISNGWLVFPGHLATGYIRYFSLPNGLQVIIINCKAHVPWYFIRKPDTEEYYSLRFDDVSIPGKMLISVQGEEQEKQRQRFSVAYLTSSLFGWEYLADAGTEIRAVNVLMTKEWLGKFLGLEMYQQILPAYIALKSKSLNMEPLDPYYLELIEEIMQEKPETPFPALYMVNRIQLLMERFFNHIHTRVSMVDIQAHFKNEDVQAVLAMEKEMVSDFSAKPPAIEVLSRKAAMSTTKFKNLFKSVFGIPVYEYYQQKRMQKACELLASGKYSVKETGLLVGYQNVSNFSAAFKKHFKKPPQDFIPN
ncbi:MAG: helix-turn-helix domain-containing protein [Lacibacter sp.]|jgi:AraC-like DNA-binding protein